MDFRPRYKNKNFEPRTKEKPISIPTLKTSNFLPPYKNQVDFDPNTEVNSTPIRTLNKFCKGAFGTVLVFSVPVWLSCRSSQRVR